MKSKYKLTRFARFLLFMIFFLPVSYYGASLYDEDIEITDLHFSFGEAITKSDDTPAQQSAENCSEIMQLKDKEISLLKKRISILENAQ